MFMQHHIPYSEYIQQKMYRIESDPSIFFTTGLHENLVFISKKKRAVKKLSFFHTPLLSLKRISKPGFLRLLLF